MKKHLVGIVTTVVVIMALIMEIYAFYQLGIYEQGFLEIYAVEQDGYVKTTLDQIERLGDEATEENITAIIASLDATTSKYWMLSTENNILFIKSVTETNKYKNYNADSYYSSGSAMDFVRSLERGKVTHALITLDDGRYIASGGIFTWKNQSYRICLLTLDKAIMDQNIMLEPKHTIIIHLTITLALFLVTVIATVNILAKRRVELETEKSRNIELNDNIEHLDKLLKREIAYDANNHIFSMSVLPEFLEKLDKKDVRPLCMAYFEFDFPFLKDEFLADITVLLDRDVIRFDATGLGVLILMTGYSMERCKEIIKDADKWYLSLKKWEYIEDNLVPYIDCFGKFWNGDAHEQYTII